MSGATIDLERQMLGHTLAIAPMPTLSRVYVALCRTAPTETAGGTEASGGGYARAAATFALMSEPSNAASNAASVEFLAATSAWGTIGYFEIWTQPTGGTRLYWGQLVDPADGVPIEMDVATGDIVRFSAGALVVQAMDITAAGGPWLPLSGGTLTTHLTGTSYNSSVNFVTTAVGSGVNGPLTAQTALSLSLYKDNWFSGPTPAVGEIDGLVIECRQGGAGSDCGGILVNVQNTGQGFLAQSEMISTRVDSVTGVITHGIVLQLGAHDPLGGFYLGTVATAHTGSLTVGHQVQNNPGAAWTYAYRNVKDNVVNYTVDSGGNVVATTVVAPNISATSHLYLRSDTAVSISWNAATGGIEFNISGPTATILGSGAMTIFGTQVLGQRVTGWGAATGGSKAAFNAATATLPQTAAALAQLITDLRAHGLIGT